MHHPGKGTVQDEILAILEKDGRASIREIASNIDIEEQQARRHLNALLSSGSIRIVAAVNLPIKSDGIVAIFLLGIAGDPQPAIDRILQLDMAPWIELCSGPVDIAFSVYASSMENLAQAMRKVFRLPGVTSVKSYICLDVIKRGYVLPPSVEDDKKGRPPKDAETNVSQLKDSPLWGPLSQDIDMMDWEIIKRLQANGRESYSSIAADLGVNEGTVRKRVKQLTKHNIINIVAMSTDIKNRLPYSGLLGVKVTGDPQIVADEMSSWPEIPWLSITDGDVCILAEVQGGQKDDLLSCLERLQRNPAVIDVDCHLFLRSIKQSLLGPIPRYGRDDK